MSKGSAPPPPDMVGAARQQGVENVETAIANRVLNNPRQQTPYGTRESRVIDYYTLGDGRRVPIFEDTTDLTPLGRQRFDQEERIIGNLGNTAERGLGRVSQAFATDFPYQSVGQMQDAAQGAILGRLQPLQDRARAQLETQMANQGIARGTEAWRNAFDDLGRQENDARIAAVTAGLGERTRAFQEATALRNQPLNELNALRTGSQVTVPQFAAAPPVNVQTPDIMGATMGQYNQQLGAYNAQQAAGSKMLGGLFSLGAGMMSAPGGSTGQMLTSRLFGLR